jgi:glycosyltransferase involved in cell wall biosynthesis
VLLAALARLPRELPWTAWILGGPQRPVEARFRDELEASAARAGILERVRFAGERSDVRALLAGADLLCQPNRTPEAFGMTFVEALAAGLPVVTTPLGGAREVLDENTGVLVDADPEKLARALEPLVASREARASLGAAGPARARALCDPARQLAALARIVERLADPARVS